MVLAIGLMAGASAAWTSESVLRVNVPVPAHERILLHNRMQLILVPRHAVPLIAFSLLVRGGARQDPPGREGTASLLADLLNYGAGERDAYAFADAVEGAGGNLNAAARAEAIEIRGQFLARDAALMLQLLSDATLRPRFDPDELIKLRDRHIEELKAAKDSSPQALIGNYGRALLFGQHPYGRPVGGSEASLARVTSADIARFYAQQVGADRATLVIAGDFAPAVMRKAVVAAFGHWQSAAQAVVALPEPARVHGRRVLLVDAPGSAQTYFWLGNVGVARRFEARAALQVSNTAFGGRFGSMLNQELRVKAGLTYDASADFTRGSVAGAFAISSFTQTDRTARAIELALATLTRLHTDGLDAPTLESARAYMLGQYPLALETSADWAEALGELELYGLPESYLGDFGSELVRVDGAAISAVIARAYPNSEDLAMVLVGDAARIREVAAKLGTVTEMTLAAPDFAPVAAP